MASAGFLEYRLVQADDTAVVVRQPARSAATTFFLVVPVGIGAWIVWQVLAGGGSFRETAVIVSLAFLGLMASIMVAIRSHWQPAHTLRFDAASGLATITGDDGETTAWPLAQFASVAVRTTRRAGSGAVARTRYHAELVLRDGAILPVLETHVEDERDRTAAALRTILAAAGDAPVDAPVHAAPGAPFTLRRERDTLVLAWRTTVRARSFASLLALLACLVTLLGTLASATLAFGGAAAWLPVGFLAIWAIVPGLVIALSLAHQLRTHQRRHVLRLASDGVHYRARGSLLPVRDDWTITWDALSAVRLAWGAGVLEFVDAATMANAPGDTRAPGDVVHDAPPARRVGLGRMPFGRVVALEQWLQGELTARAGRPIA